jgi:hypothetical protein
MLNLSPCLAMASSPDREAQSLLITPRTDCPIEVSMTFHPRPAGSPLDPARLIRNSSFAFECTMAWGSFS